MGNENTKQNIWSDTRKWSMEDPKQSGVDVYVYV